MECVDFEFSYGKKSSARLGYAAVRAFRWFDPLTYSFDWRKARTAAAKECGGILYVAEFYIDALYHGNENRQR